MFANFFSTFRSYSAFYEHYFSNEWDHLSPTQYASLLICVCAFGWLLMKTGNKRS